MKKLTRGESSKECRRVLNRHGVDLTKCFYTCSGYEIRLYGRLERFGGGEYHSSQVECIIQDFKKAIRGISIYGDLENWSFSSEHISFLGEKEGLPAGEGETLLEGYFANEFEDEDAA